ncbi:hypothetical protein GCM10022197_07960 [Microlunatus spumicola]|uniref:Integral membrane protein n=1 Tax=Microlunatus spumicola TaxID=81499 RepID=A0ABP6WSE8_9ACTN
MDGVADLETRTRPPQLTAAAALVGLEALVALAFGIAEIGQVRLFRAVVGVGVAFFMVGFAVLLGAAARGLLRLSRWARGPVVAVQLIMLPVGWSFRGGQTTEVAVAMVVVALVTLVLVLHPRSTAALVVPSETDDDA